MVRRYAGDSPKVALSGHYILAPHVCRYCLGRVVQNVEVRRFRCSTCGVSAPDYVADICGCGIRPKMGAANRFRCIRNPKIGPSSPLEIVIMFGDRPIEVATEPSATAA